jgi:hypothetical protein
MTPLTSLTLLRDILLGHHVTRSRISVFHADLSTIQRSLDLHAVPHATMTLVQCRRALLHHIATGACADYQVDAVSSPRPDRTACRALSQDFKCAAEMSKAVLNIFLDADHKQMSTENLSHLAAALNIYVSGVRTLRFKLRAAIRKHADTINAANSRISTSASIADFFNSFESHRKPILLSIAALHRIQVPDKSTVESLRATITDHILSGSCTQFSQSHARITLSGDFSLPDCADVCDEWQHNNLDPDLQVHILNGGMMPPMRPSTVLVPSRRQARQKNRDAPLLVLASDYAHVISNSVAKHLFIP